MMEALTNASAAGAARTANFMDGPMNGWLLERNWLPAALLLICVSRLWLAPLTSSFWVDEMGTEFVVLHGATHPSLAVAPQVPASIYFALPRAAQFVFGMSELALRLPSLLSMSIALLLIAYIAQKLIHPEAGWFVMFSCLLLRDFNFQAADARPYALGTFFCCASFVFLIRWLDSDRWFDGAAFAVLAALIWRVHLVFWPIYAVFAIYTVVRVTSDDSAAAVKKVATVYFLIGLSLVPVVAQAVALNRQATAHVVAPMPTFADLARELRLGFLAPFCAVSALMGLWFRWPRKSRLISPQSLVLVLVWWLVPAICLFAFSHVTGNSLFVSRYLCLALPGVALAATVTAGAFLPVRYWRPAAIALGAGVLIFHGRWDRLLPTHFSSDWRAAALAVNSELSGPDEPVICPSPFIEAREPGWRPDYPMPSFLYSQLVAYPIRGHIYPFPYESSALAEQFAATQLQEAFSPAGNFIIYGNIVRVRFWRAWFRSRSGLAGWRVRELGPFGDVSAVVFKRPGDRPPQSSASLSAYVRNVIIVGELPIDRREKVSTGLPSIIQAIRSRSLSTPSLGMDPGMRGVAAIDASRSICSDFSH